MQNGSIMRSERQRVIQDEATRESSKSRLPMFGEKFGGWAPQVCSLQPSRHSAAAGVSNPFVVTDSQHMYCWTTRAGFI
jgi:hypothetical protein